MKSVSRLAIVVGVACGTGGGGQRHAVVPSDDRATDPTCAAVAEHVAHTALADLPVATARDLVARHCASDHWSPATRAWMLSATPWGFGEAVVMTDEQERAFDIELYVLEVGLEIVVDEVGRPNIASRRVTDLELAAILRATVRRDPDAAVVVRAEPHASQEHVATLLERLRRAGFAHVTTRL